MKAFAQSAANDAKKLAHDSAVAATAVAGSDAQKDIPQKVTIHAVAEPVEFTDTDGDVSRLAMDDSGALIWYEQDAEAAGGWTEWEQGPFVFTWKPGSTGELSSADDDNDAFATIKCPEATA